MPSSLHAADGSVLAFDVVESEQFSTSVVVTAHPIEDGADVADHAQPQPPRIFVTGVVSESPWSAQPGVGVSTVTGSTSGLSRVLKAIDFLRALEGQLFDYVSEARGTFTNCVLENVAETRAGRAAGRFDLAIRQLRVATSAAVVIPPDQTSSPSAADEQDTGTQPTATVPETAAESDVSALKTILAAIGG
jgi:hypothetical protein